jgi:hypothetical protein
MSSSDASRAGAAVPAIDDRLAVPETRSEIVDGAVVHVPPADAPHGTRHAQVTALLEAHAAARFDVACDMLTRTSETSDVAPDVSVFPDDPDPETGGRQLEQLAFEIVSTESLGHAGGKAAKLVARGVRRVFAIDVERSRLLEWSSSLGTWTVLDGAARIGDPALDAALPVDMLVRAAKTDDAVARALIIKRNPVIEATRAQDRAEGEIKGRIEGEIKGVIRALLVLLNRRGISVDDAALERIQGEQDPQQLDHWIAHAATCTTIAELFASV